ncbi:hypothetical protein [[Clostridium] aminophilum]|uniref:hypothetical protein n=1 Tax=[Clostridium] aminophilum TaxID=1526 RepID=UPI000B20AE35|nr:hypothetical protein [[Clostridium] aminophilum]
MLFGTTFEQALWVRMLLVGYRVSGMREFRLTVRLYHGIGKYHGDASGMVRMTK